MDECSNLKSILMVLGLMFLLVFFIPFKFEKPNTEKALLFKSYAKGYGKTYTSEEYQKRFNTFQENIEYTKYLNSLSGSQPDSAVYGINEFADLSKEEFRSRHLSSHQHRQSNRTHHHHHHHHKRRPSDTTNHVVKRAVNSNLPQEVDWRSKNVVTGVKNQKTCGACWAFSTIETVESMLAIKNGTLLKLSVQEIIDCARNGNLGCNGGDTCNLLEWLVDNKIKIEQESQYPLTLRSDVCKLKSTSPGIQVAPSFSCDTLVGNEDAILSILANHGPVAVAVNALSWQYYLGGVIQYHCDGSLTSLNHAVQLVGYNLGAPIPYYIARNSWGTLFGEKGYLRIAIGSNVCGVATEVASLDVL